jgi:tripartite-type tricarboxylate transporter receptor subunit TctC
VGVKDLDVSTWWGILAPASTPKAVVDKLNSAINEVSSKELIKERFASEGALTQVGSPQEFQTNSSQRVGDVARLGQECWFAVYESHDEYRLKPLKIR